MFSIGATALAETIVPAHRARTTRLTALGITRVMATDAPATVSGIHLPAGTLIECVQGLPGRLPEMYLVRPWREDPERHRIHRFRVPGGSWRHGLAGYMMNRRVHLLAFGHCPNPRGHAVIEERRVEWAPAGKAPRMVRVP